MSSTIDEWLRKIKPYRDMVDTDPKKYYGEVFFRDPIQPQYIDCDYFYSPASGIIINQGIIKPGEKIVDVKGIQYTPKKLLADDTFDKESLIISIFMTQFSTHTNFMPTDGVISWRFVEPLQTKNKPMIFEERDLLKGKVNIQDETYPVNNGRVVNCIRNGSYEYYLVQIADSDVNVIAPFSQRQGTHYFQNERFGVVRYGSQVCLIMPLTDSFAFQPLEKVKRVVEAGIDKLVFVKSKKDHNIKGVKK